jgi:hypothetical protein
MNLGRLLLEVPKALLEKMTLANLIIFTVDCAASTII